MSLGIRYQNQNKIFREVEKETPFLEYPLLADTGAVRHGFSTRLGGVSEGCFSSLNLGFHRGDREEAVQENFRWIAASMGVRCEDMVLSRQTHTTNVWVVTEEDRGMGMTCPMEYSKRASENPGRSASGGFQLEADGKLEGVDGLVTNIPGICLVTFYADCVPLFFVDPVKKAIGLSHSGWRGTVGKIGRVTVELMQQQYGCDPSDILAAVGPSVCRDCYEVSKDVIERFRESFAEKYWKDLFYQKENGKYQLDLWKANEIIFAEAGILPEHTAVTNVCTHCNSEVLYSHRTAGNERGSLAAFLTLA